MIWGYSVNDDDEYVGFNGVPADLDNDRKITKQIVLSSIILVVLVFNLLCFLTSLFLSPLGPRDYLNMALNGAATVGCLYSLYLGIRTLKNRYIIKLEIKTRQQIGSQLPESLIRFRGLNIEHAFFHPYGWNTITEFFLLIDDAGGFHVCRAYASINKDELSLENMSVEDRLESLFARKSKSDLNEAKLIAESIAYDDIERIIQLQRQWSDDFAIIAISKYPVLADRYQSEEACRQWAISLLGGDSPIFGEGFTLQNQLCGALGALTDLILVRGSADIEMPSSVLQRLVDAQEKQPTEDRAIALFRWIKAILDGDSVQFGGDVDDDWSKVCPNYLLSSYCRMITFRTHLFGENPACPDVLKTLFITLLAPWVPHNPYTRTTFTDEMIKGYHRIYGMESAMQLFPDKTRLFLENDLDL